MLGLDVVEVGDVPVAVRHVARGEVAERAGVAGREPPAQLRQRGGVGALGTGERPVDEPDADLEVDGHVDAGVELQLHAVAPRAEVVEPAGDLVLPAAELVGHERGA